MFKSVLCASVAALALLATPPALYASAFGRSLCKQPGFQCVKVARGQTWHSLFPDETTRGLVMRLNRTNAELWRGQMIAVPEQLNFVDHMDFSPLPQRIEPPGRRVLIINLAAHAFGAYDESGFLLHWGPVSGGRNWCPDIQRSCRTPVGTFAVHSKGDAYCISTKYPVGEGGAPMPFCMFFHGGYAMHASYLPGYHASHGCVRMFYEDAEWLSKHFVRRGTRVIVQGYRHSENEYEDFYEDNTYTFKTPIFNFSLA